MCYEQEMEPVHLEQQLELRQQQLREVAGTVKASKTQSAPLPENGSNLAVVLRQLGSVESWRYGRVFRPTSPLHSFFFSRKNKRKPSRKFTFEGLERIHIPPNMIDQRRSACRRYLSRAADAMATVHRTRVSPEAPPGDRRLQARRRTGELPSRNGTRERRTPQTGAGRTREVRSLCSMELKC